jgi:hypothetical protein
MERQRWELSEKRNNQKENQARIRRKKMQVHER